LSFLDRLRPLRYVSPSGVEHLPLYDDLDRNGGKKAPIHEFPHRDIADVQDLGNKAETYSMTLYFTGADYDMAADAFYQALREKGRAKLMHPRWGDIDVLPLSRSQSEKFVEGIRYAEFSVEFVEAPDPRSLAVTTTTASAIQASATLTASTTVESVSEQMAPADAIETEKIKEKVLERAVASRDALNSMTAELDDLRAQVVAAGKAIERNIDDLVDDPLALADAMVALVRSPALAAMSITGKVKGYASLITSGIASLSDLIQCAAAAAAADLFGLIIAQAEATTEGTLSSRAEAVEAYDILTGSVEDVLEAIEGLDEYVQDPEVIAQIRQISTDARARLLTESYSLPTERRMVLQGNSNPISLAYQIYGDPERMDDVIEQNHLIGEQLLVIPRDTEIRWYE
jgi:prophage DNA circulation protein